MLFLLGDDMKRSCPYCGGIHDAGAICPRKPKENRSGRHTSKAGDLRKKNSWKEKSIEIRKRDRYLCRTCLEKGILNTRKLSVHHIVPINEDEKLWLTDSNLITLCDKCHERAEVGMIERNYLKGLTSTKPKLSPRG